MGGRRPCGHDMLHRMGVRARSTQLLGLARVLTRDPGQVRFVRRWAASRGRGTLELGLPWLPFSLMELLEEVLTPTSRVFEYGGGGSTVWFAARAGEVVTVEHDEQWASILAAAVADCSGCVVHSRRLDSADDSYVRSIQEHPDGYFDIVVVDGRERVRCLEAAREKVRPGALLLLDDAQRPRYAPAYELLAEWPLRTVFGLAPTKPDPGTTAVWTRP